MSTLPNPDSQYNRDVEAFARKLLPSHMFTDHNTIGSIEVDEKECRVQLVSPQRYCQGVEPGQYAALIREGHASRLFMVTHVSSPDQQTVMIHGLLPEASREYIAQNPDYFVGELSSRRDRVIVDDPYCDKEVDRDRHAGWFGKKDCIDLSGLNSDDLVYGRISADQILPGSGAAQADNGTNAVAEYMLRLLISPAGPLVRHDDGSLAPARLETLS